MPCDKFHPSENNGKLCLEKTFLMKFELGNHPQENLVYARRI